MIKLRSTPRGFIRGEFEDRYGQKCSVQESSIVAEACVWLGVDVDLGGKDVSARMHLTQQTVRDLMPLLRHFARTGTLGYDDPKEIYQVGTWVIGVGDLNRGVEGRVVEINHLNTVLVQDNNKSGEEGLIACAWDRVNLVWEPTEPPEAPLSRYERLMDDDETQ